MVLLRTLIALPGEAFENPHVIDLADVSTDQNVLLRAHGYTGTGAFGVPVAGGFNVDGDGRIDYAFSSMRASPRSRIDACEVCLFFGDGTVNGTRDTGLTDSDALTFIGDGIADILVGADQTTEFGEEHRGAVYLIRGGSHLTVTQTIDLARRAS